MISEAQIIIGFLFKRSGKKTLPASDVYLAISMELKWCSPKEAKTFVKKAMDASLLSEAKQGITPSFPVDSITIPTGFLPSKDCFSKWEVSSDPTPNKDIINIVVSRVKQKIQMDEDEIKKEIREIALNNLLLEEVAAVFYAKKRDIEIDDLLKYIGENIVISGKNKA